MQTTNMQNDKERLLAAIRNGDLPSERSKEYWSEEEREEVRRKFGAGKGISELALQLQRSENAVIQQLTAMEMLTPPGRHRRRKKKMPMCCCPRCKETACPHYKGGVCCVGAVR